MKKHGFVIALCAVLQGHLFAFSGAPKDLLLYQQPAGTWTEALPIGNGRLGAMVFGGTEHERLQLNEITVWSGGPQRDTDRRDAYKSLPELRQLLADGKYDVAEKFANANFNSPAPYTASYQTLGDLTYDFTLPSTNISEYRRSLDLSQALSEVSFQSGGIVFHRESFASAPAAAIMQRFTADHPGSISFTMHLSRIERAHTRALSPHEIEMDGDTGGVLRYRVLASIRTHGGTVQSTPDGALHVIGVDSAEVVLTAATNYVLDYDAGYTGANLDEAAKHMSADMLLPYDILRSQHILDFRKYYDRVSLQLGPSSDKPTDERLKEYAAQRDPSMLALVYDYGRYLLISSSRPDNPLPANLQGIWGDGLTLPWLGDYHTNINVEMNYWPAETANLSEMQLPMIHLIESLVKPGEKTARAYYGPQSPGWVMGYTTNAWGWTSPGEELPWGVWFGASAWVTQHLWEHYAFTRDLGYLRQAYPTMKGAAEFWMANLVEGPDGKLIVSPSSSPENGFRTDRGMVSEIDAGATMDRELVWNLLNNVAMASSQLGVDAEFREKALTIRDRIEPLHIGRNGQLMEWSGDWDDPNSHHRHISHLFALFPGSQISVTETPKLAAAAEETLRERGDESTGWALTWRANCWARLHKGDRALDLLSNLLHYTKENGTNMEDGGGLYPDLFDAHPPFQIDGNFGAVSAMNEMLLQSQDQYVDPTATHRDRYYIDLLPALPQQWRTGLVRGLLARGGFEVSEQWADGRLVSAAITSRGGVAAIIRYQGRQVSLTWKQGETIKLDGNLK
ncbi:glycoside hydrolase family 95 protein [Acidicapsa dinghuensis]|uniref:Glycoside hydrolase family 95 protein n=1 Tax=Acidicapsa dinghuensis TaxID=2218256 RepID=A0ABW1EGL2_9BACT|nr:glycoside hydrolase family 95 protein [Acidicapsa dinghuensis]